MPKRLVLRNNGAELWTSLGRSLALALALPLLVCSTLTATMDRVGPCNLPGSPRQARESQEGRGDVWGVGEAPIRVDRRAMTLAAVEPDWSNAPLRYVGG